MDYGHLSLLPESMKSMNRKYENLKKLINAEWLKVFNCTCLKDINVRKCGCKSNNPTY